MQRLTLWGILGTQDNLFAKEVTLKDMQTFQLGLFNGGPLQVSVSEGTRFINRFNRLSALVSEPLDAVEPATELTTGDTAGSVGDNDESLNQEGPLQDDTGLADELDAQEPAELEEGEQDAQEDAGQGDNGVAHSDEQEHPGSPDAEPEQEDQLELRSEDTAEGDEALPDGTDPRDDPEAGSVARQQEQEEQAAQEQAFRHDYAGFDPDDHTRLAMPDPINTQQKRAARHALDGHVVDNPADTPGT